MHIKTIISCLLMTLLGGSHFAQDITWAKQIGGIGVDYSNAIHLDPVGNVYTIGTFSGTVDFDPGAATFEMTAAAQNSFISKLDADGNFIWAKQLVSNASNNIKSIAFDAEGNLYLTGWFEGTADLDPGNAAFNLISAGANDLFILRLDADGNFNWVKHIGGTGNDMGDAITIDASGNSVTTGSFNNTVDFDPGAGVFNLSVPEFKTPLFVLKLDSSGNFLWAKQIGTDEETISLQGGAIKTDAQDNIHILGAFVETVDFDPGAGVVNLSTNDFFDAFLLKLNASGDYVYVVQQGTPGFDLGNSLDIDGFGNVYATGYVSPQTGNSVAYILKVNPDGTILWIKYLDSTGITDGRSLVMVSGHLYITGLFSGITDFDPNASASTVEAAGIYDGYILSLTTDGEYRWVKTFGGPNVESSNSIALNTLGDIYATGVFYGTATYTTTSGTTTLTSLGNDDIFILKLQDTFLGIEEHVLTKEIKVYPNPTNGNVTIQFSKVQNDMKVQITDMLGKVISTAYYASATSIEHNIDAPSGVYMVHVSKRGEFKKSFKIIKY